MADVITLSSDEESPTPPKRTKPMYLGSVSITPVKKKLPKEVYPREDVVVISDDINTSLLKNISITTVAKPKRKYTSRSEDVVVLSDEDVPETDEKSIKSLDRNIAEESNDEDCEIICESGPENPSNKGINFKQNSSCKESSNQNATLNQEIKENTFVDHVIDNEESNYENCSDKRNCATKTTSLEVQKADNKVEETAIHAKEKYKSIHCDAGDGESYDEDCEIISECNSEKSSSKENEVRKTSSSQNSIKNKPTNNIPGNSLLEVFLQVCKNSVQDTQYDEILKKFPILQKLYKKCDSELIQSQSFQRIIEENTKRADKSATKAVISFREVYQHIKDVVEAASIEVNAEQRLRLKKLEKTIRALLKKIKQLEEVEVDFEDEEDSSFIQLTRYTDRLNKVYHKYCELMKKNPYTGRLTYAKLDFADSDFNEINRAISKKYKNRKFPSYIAMQKFIEKVVEDNNLPLSEARIKSESIHCFKKLGELMQSRRKKELYDSHYMYIRDGEDPADKDPSLNSKLRDSHKEGLSKIEKVCEEYAMQEELGKEAGVEDEEESDKSDYVDSENEEDVTSPSKKDKVVGIDIVHEYSESTEHNKSDQE